MAEISLLFPSLPFISSHCVGFIGSSPAGVISATTPGKLLCVVREKAVCELLYQAPVSSNSQHFNARKKYSLSISALISALSGISAKARIVTVGVCVMFWIGICASNCAFVSAGLLSLPVHPRTHICSAPLRRAVQLCLTWTDE